MNKYSMYENACVFDVWTTNHVVSASCGWWYWSLHNQKLIICDDNWWPFKNLIMALWQQLNYRMCIKHKNRELRRIKLTTCFFTACYRFGNMFLVSCFNCFKESPEHCLILDRWHINKVEWSESQFGFFHLSKRKEF